jgi:hypothetical protein
MMLFESLPRIRCNQVLAQETALGLLIFLCCQTQPPESSNQGRIDRFPNPRLGEWIVVGSFSPGHHNGLAPVTGTRPLSKVAARAQ